MLRNNAQQNAPTIATSNDLEHLEQRLTQQLEIFLQSIAPRLPIRMLTPTDIARYYRTTKFKLTTKPWLIPNFGISDIPDNSYPRWHRETLEKWVENLEKHRIEWQNMPLRERDRLMARAKEKK